MRTALHAKALGDPRSFAFPGFACNGTTAS